MLTIKFQISFHRYIDITSKILKQWKNLTWKLTKLFLFLPVEKLHWRT